jgi:adenylosuccinate synthase
MSRNSAVVGINWGDEGKGRMVDLLTAGHDVVVRYQGGGNAGHTVVNEYGKFSLHLIPSGIFRKGVVNVLGSGVALDPENLCREIEELRSRGVEVSPDNLMISERASLLMPWHRDLDALEEERLGSAKYGSTKQGIAPFYSDKYQKKTLMAGEIRYPEEFRSRLASLTEWKDLVLEGVYGARGYTLEDIGEWAARWCEPLKPFIRDTGAWLEQADAEGKRLLFEAQLGALRDIDQGIYPYTTSSNTLAAYAPVGAGCPSVDPGEVIGVVKAYSTCVGEGPFVCELKGEAGEELRRQGAEYGAKTGRPRRVGPYDAVATREGVRLQGADCIALTKLDVLSYLKSIPVCVAYRVGDEVTERFPFPVELEGAEPVLEELPGWGCDISSVRSFDELPKEARDYVLFVEKSAGCPVKYVSVGPERDSIIVRQ